MYPNGLSWAPNLSVAVAGHMPETLHGFANKWIRAVVRMTNVKSEQEVYRIF